MLNKHIFHIKPLSFSSFWRDWSLCISWRMSLPPTN